MKQVYAYCIQGDVLSAYQYLSENAHTGEEKQLLKRYYNRFIAEKPILRVKSEDPWVKSVIKAYYQYFISVLTNKDKMEAENTLLLKLKGLVTTDENIMDLDEAEEQLKMIFEEKGYHFLGGVTPPFRGPYIWKTMDKKEYEVELPDGTEKLTVYFMSDFILHSWLHFATFGAKAAGGWATQDAIYCVYDSYKEELNTKEFEVSFLKHEAQHFSDFKQFPKLVSKDLEYRAKLVQLIYHPSDKLLQSFLAEAKNDVENPHPYSSYKIMSQLSWNLLKQELNEDTESWYRLDKQLIKEEAKQLFNSHTQQLIRNGEKEVEGII